MYPRDRKAARYPFACISVICMSAASLLPVSVTGQTLGDQVTQISGSGSVFTGVTHAEGALGAVSDSITEPSVGVSGNLGGQLESGANSLSLRYGGTLESTRELVGGGQTNPSVVTGVSRYVHADPASRFDFNLGHTVSSVRNNTGFVLNPSRYDMQNSFRAGAGVRFFPGELSTLRFSGQAGQSFGRGDLNNRQSFTASTELSRRLTQRSTVGVNGSRSWSDYRGTDITIDSVQLTYRRALENGSFSIGAGPSRSDTRFIDGTVSESSAGTGFIYRTWEASDWRTSVQYDRKLSDSATDLSLDTPVVFDFLPETIRLRNLVISDSVSLAHSTEQLCSACSLGFAARVALLESAITGSTIYEYNGSVRFGLDLTSLQRLSFYYSYQGDARGDSGTIVDEIHRFNTSWTRQLAEDTLFSVQLNQAYLSSTRIASRNQRQFILRLVFTRGFSLTSQRN